MEDPEKVRAQKRRWYQRHKEKIKARSAARYERLKDTPGFQKKATERTRAWRKKNWSRFLENAKAWQKAARGKHPEWYRAKAQRKYQRIKADPKRYKRHLETNRKNGRTPGGKLIKHNYRVRRRNAIGSHTVAQWLARVTFYNWSCFYCGKPLTVKTLTKDHVIPLSKHGTDWASNLVPACQSCNARKKDRLPTAI